MNKSLKGDTERSVRFGLLNLNGTAQLYLLIWCVLSNSGRTFYFFRKVRQMEKQLKAKIVNYGMDTSFGAHVCECFSLDGLDAFNSSEYTVVPGFCDVHVHFREPGFS